MKARFVNEINFQRGREPKDTMGIGVVADGKMVIPAGRYPVYLWYYPSDYAAQKKTNKFIDVKQQVVDYKDDNYYTRDRMLKIYARPEELKPLQQIYDRRSPDGGGHYFIWAPDPLGRTSKGYWDAIPEGVSFKRGQEPKDSMSIGKKHDPEVFIANAVADLNGKPLEDDYDIRKFFQNLEMGMFPQNLFAANLQDESGTFWRAGDEAWKGDELKREGYKEVFFRDKYYKIG